MEVMDLLAERNQWISIIMRPTLVAPSDLLASVNPCVISLPWHKHGKFVLGQGQTGRGEKGYKLKQQGPWAFVGIDQNFDFYYTKSTAQIVTYIVDQLDDIHPNLSKWVVGALLKQFNKEMDKPLNSLNNWPRTSDNRGTSTRLERIGKNNGDLHPNITTKVGRLALPCRQNHVHHSNF